MKFNNILWGLVLIILGVIIGLNALEIIKINIFFDGFWTLFLIVPGFIGILTEKDKVGNLILLLIGIFLLLAVRGIIDFSLLLKLLLPIILIIIGASLIFKESLMSKVKKNIKKIDSENIQEYSATFSNQSLNFAEENFENCKLTSVFGSINCDLTKSKIKNNSYIKSEAIFGNIEIKVPDDVLVKVISTSIFGKVTNKKTQNDSKKILYIEAMCLFGGIEIK